MLELGLKTKLPPVDDTTKTIGAWDHRRDAAKTHFTAKPLKNLAWWGALYTSELLISKHADPSPDTALLLGLYCP